MAENKKKDSKYDGMTASKAKRERAKDERAAAKRNAARNKMIMVAVAVAIVALIVGVNVRNWIKEKNKTVASTDFSAMLNDDGTIKDVNVTDYVKTFDVNAVKIAKADVEYTDEQLQEDINSELSSHQVLSNDKTLTVADGSEVNINYVGTMDGVEFEGGSAEEYDLTIGSGSFIDDFETQLIGTHPGDEVTVNVTFPEEYENNPDLAGKDATFAVTINGIYELPAFDDAFVQENLSEYAQTADEYRQYLRDTNYESKLNEAVDQYITDNISADSYPTDYLKHLKSLQMTINEWEYNYMQQIYATYGLTFDYSGVKEYYGAANDDEYEKVLQEAAEKQCLSDMAYQDLAAQAGIAVTDEQYEAFLAERGLTEEDEDEYGRGYIIQQQMLRDLVESYIAEHATVE